MSYLWFFASIEVMIWQQSQFLQYAYVCLSNNSCRLQKYNKNFGSQKYSLSFMIYFQLMFSLLQFNHCVFFMCNLSAFKMLQHNYTYYEKSIQGSWCSNCWFRFYRKSGIIVKTKAMHTSLEMKGISTKTICTACYHLTIVVFCTIKE